MEEKPTIISNYSFFGDGFIVIHEATLMSVGNDNYKMVLKPLCEQEAFIYKTQNISEPPLQFRLNETYLSLHSCTWNECLKTLLLSSCASL